jgi:hypothetical protein
MWMDVLLDAHRHQMLSRLVSQAIHDDADDGVVAMFSAKTFDGIKRWHGLHHRRRRSCIYSKFWIVNSSRNFKKDPMTLIVSEQQQVRCEQ